MLSCGAGQRFDRRRETRNMKCLSIRQPWAWLVCVGAKTIENRSWATTYRGVIAIHASGYTKAVDGLVSGENAIPGVERELFAFGAIVGVAEIYDVVPICEPLRQNPWAEGPYCIMLRNAQLFVEPIPHKGRVNLCDLPCEVSELVEKRLENCVEINADKDIVACAKAIPCGPISQQFLRPSFRSRM